MTFHPLEKGGGARANLHISEELHNRAAPGNFLPWVQLIINYASLENEHFVG